MYVYKIAYSRSSYTYKLIIISTHNKISYIYCILCNKYTLTSGRTGASEKLQIPLKTRAFKKRAALPALAPRKSTDSVAGALHSCIHGCYLQKCCCIQAYMLYRAALLQSYFSVAYITALMVCIRFSASSNTFDCFDSNTSSATSISVTPNFLAISAPMVVLVSWNEGRQ